MIVSTIVFLRQSYPEGQKDNGRYPLRSFNCQRTMVL